MTDLKVDKSNYESSFSMANKVGRLIWNLVRFLFFRPFIPRMFDKWRVFILKCFGANIEWTSTVYASAKIWAPWNLEMGAYATLGPEVDCYNQGKIIIKAHTTVSQKSYLCSSSHDISDPKFKLVLKPITIEEEAWIAADTFIGPGVSIGRGAVIAARSAVFDDVEAWSVMRGNPAVLIKKRAIKSK
jgi:putative colanic acid biosynthesis acetyltransferase WcaF